MCRHSEDEETVHYSMSEGEGDDPAPTATPPAPEGTAGAENKKK